MSTDIPRGGPTTSAVPTDPAHVTDTETTLTPRSRSAMLMHHELARAQHATRVEEARRQRRATVLLAVRRAARRQAAAQRRARLATEAAAYAAVRVAVDAR
ncbi:MAG: hypothetical protein R2737_02375 [Candidatus Nanopelagicales bacterium]